MLKAPKQMKHVLKWSRKYYKALYLKYIDDEFIAKAEKTALAMEGLKEQEHLDEYNKWKELLISNNRKQRRK